MREIKFRVLKNGCWYTLDLENPAGIARELLARWGEDIKDFLFETPWLQYTGLEDKNGVEIYEGDVLRDGKNPKLIGVVFWNDLRAMFGIDPSACDSEAADSGKFIAPFDDWLDWEVIGNIYENPELLREGS